MTSSRKKSASRPPRASTSGFFFFRGVQPRERHVRFEAVAAFERVRLRGRPFVGREHQEPALAVALSIEVVDASGPLLEVAARAMELGVALRPQGEPARLL